MNSQLRTITIIALLITAALGAAALTGFWHPNAPQDAFKAYLPQITLGTVLVAGAVDGLNPCAFTAPSGSLGAGYDVRVGRNFSLTPFINALATSGVKFKLGGVEVTSDIKINLVQLGLGVTWH